MMNPAPESEFAQDRAAVLRYCLRYTGDVDVAEDLTQLTMLEGWKHESELRDPAARQKWLLGIARNMCRMWGRTRVRERLRRVDASFEDDPWPANEVDLEIELERAELATLLDRALALLPPDTRDVLIRRYIDESPQAHVAAHLGISEGAVEARLHRGKIALRRVLTTEFSADAHSYGLIRQDEIGWETTRVWCPGCGSRPLEGKLDPGAGTLDMRCADCSLPALPDFLHSSLGDKMGGVRTFKPAVSRVLDFIHELFRVDAAAGGLHCPSCGQWTPIRQSEELGIYLECRACDWRDQESWHSLTWSLPEARGFWQNNPRMRFLPPREVEAEGMPAIVTCFESVTGADRLEVVMLRDSLKVVRINGGHSSRSLS